MTKLEVNYIVSFGITCHTARFLQARGFRKCAYPLDWVFNKIWIINDCLLTNFCKLLNPEHYIKINAEYDPNLKITSHKLYGHKFFNHHDLTGEKDYELFTRSVNRFNQLLMKEESKIFMTMYVNRKCGLNDLEKCELKNLNATLSMKTKNYKILVVAAIISDSHKFTVNEDVENNIIYLDLYVTSESNGTHFIMQLDNKFLDDTILNMFNFKIINDIK